MSGTEVKVPRLAESISEAVLVQWLKQDGETVRVDEPIATLETDKAAVELPAEFAGALRHLRKVGDTVHVGDVIARIISGAAEAAPPTASGADAGAPAPPKSPPAPAPALRTSAPALPARPTAPVPRANAAPAPSVPQAAAPTRTPAPRPDDDGRLSPAVRRMVEEHGLDPAAIPASGPGGRLLKEDVQRFVDGGGAAATSPAAASQTQRPAAPPTPGPKPPAPAPKPAPKPVAAAAPMAAPKQTGDWAEGETERAVPMSRIRIRIAERLVMAQHTAAILTTFNEVDMTAVMDLRARYKESFEQRHGVRLSFMSFFGRACILALQQIPEINAEIRGTDTIYKRHVHLGVAVGTERGLVVPVVKQADQRTFPDLEREIARLAAQARDNKLTLDELSGGTFTISNGGVYGSLLSTPILNPPQSGILGMHKIEKRPIAVEDQVVIRPMMYLALSYDHRIVDGEQAVTFLVSVKERLEDPERLLVEV